MHRWLLLLFIALLPLRGWVGDAMAGQMLQHRFAQAAMAAEATAPVAATASPMHDCPGHDMTAAAPAADSGPAAPMTAMPDDCPTCASCQVCSSVALALPVGTPVSEVFTASPPASHEAHDASVHRSRALKPPIA